MPNPFYVQPGGNWSEGLKGLADTMLKVGEKKKEEADKIKLEHAKMQALNAFKTGDPEKMMEVSLANPEMAPYLQNAINFKNEKTKDNFFQSSIEMIKDPTPENVARVHKARQEYLKHQGVKDTEVTDSFLNNYKKDPAGTLKKLEMMLPAIFPKRYKAMKEAIMLPKVTPYTDMGKLNTDYMNGKIPKAYYEQQRDKLENPQAKPYTNLAKLRYDFENKYYSPSEYIQLRDEIINPKAKNKIELVRDALHGDTEAQQILKVMIDDAAKQAGLSAEEAAKGKLKALKEIMDIEGTARAIYEGRETIDQVKNTFGIPVQEWVRAEVFDIAEEETGKRDFNFTQPRAIRAALEGTLKKMQKNYGVMDAFIQTISLQGGRLKEIMKEVERTEIRALNWPYREFKTRAIGSGKEKKLELLASEISAELDKLIQNSQDSVAQLPAESRKKFERIHDINLPYGELIQIIDWSEKIAKDRYKAFGNAITTIKDDLKNVRTLGTEPFSEDDPEGLFAE